jgi:hypothetical protein
MRAQVTDRDAIASLSPLSVIGYLRANGWSRYSDSPGKFSVWVSSDSSAGEIVIPYKRDASDFIALLARALSELEQFEGRSQLDIVRDLLNSGFDVVRLAAKSPSTSDGSIRVDEGLLLFQQAREMLMSAACATVTPRPVFHARKPQLANEYIETARLGQTEHGSFVLTMLSPVSPQFNAHSDTDLFPGDPFERQVVRTLIGAVGLTVEAAEVASTTGTFTPFQDAVSGGVSANLCEALVGLFSVGEPVRMELSVAWALNRPQPPAALSRVALTRDFLPAISEAARMFRARDVLEAYTVQGPVVKLERAENEPEGRVTIYAPIEDVLRKVVVTLSSEDYEKAMAAHREYLQVRVVGDVKREGRSYRVHSHVSFSLVQDDSESLF